MYRAELEERGLYDLLRERGTNMRVARQFVSAREASEEEARLLHIRAGNATLVLDRTAYDHSGRVVEVATTLYRPDRYRIGFTVVER